MPDGVRIYAIGDVHGRDDLLDQALVRIDDHLFRNRIARPIQVFLGDYIDRGPSSRSVIDRLIDRGRSCEVVFLKGNHEVFLTTFLEDPFILDEWRNFGGLDTLVSYGLRPSAKISAREQTKLAIEFGNALPPSHRQFFSGLKLTFVCGDYFFVHAGVRPGVALELQKETDLCWIRNDFLKHEERFSKIIIHGHSPVALPEIRSNRVNIDTGAYATGILTCLIIEADKLAFL